MLAPILRPVKEPGPDIKVISEMSLKDLPFSTSLSRMYSNSFSARSCPDSHLYVLLSNFRIVIGEEVSKYNFMV